MGSGKIIALIGGILGVLSIVLFYALPEIFSLWRFDGGATMSMFVGGFGVVSGELLGIPYGPEPADDVFLTIISVLLIAGGAIAIIGGLMDSKPIGALGGLLMIIGPIVLILELVLELGFWEGFPEFALWGSQAGADWGVWIGFFIGLGGGVLGLIGAASMD